MTQNSSMRLWINKAADIVILSALWTLCALPLVTVGASSAALYYSVTRVLRKEKGYAFRSFIANFRISLRQTLSFSIVSLLLSLTFSFVIYFFSKNPMGFFSELYSVFSLICLALTALFQIYAYALIGRFNLSNREILSIILQLMGRNILRSLILLIMFAVVIDLIFLYPPLILLLPASYTLFLSILMEPVFQQRIRYTEE